VPRAQPITVTDIEGVDSGARALCYEFCCLLVLRRLWLTAAMFCFKQPNIYSQCARSLTNLNATTNVCTHDNMVRTVTFEAEALSIYPLDINMLIQRLYDFLPLRASLTACCSLLQPGFTNTSPLLSW
jgi:hypothetical protein